MADPYLTEVAWSGMSLRLLGRLEPDGSRPAEAELLLRERDGDGLISVPAVLPAAGGHLFEALIDITSVCGDGPLPNGLWDVELAVGPNGVARAVPLGHRHAPGLDPTPQRRFLAGSTTVTVYFGAYGTLAIDVGGRAHPGGSTRAETLAWNEHDDELVVSGHITFQDIAMPVSAKLRLREPGSGRRYEVIAALEAGGDRLTYTASVPLTRAFTDDPLPRGTWEAFLVLGFSGMHRELRVMAPEHPIGLQVWRRLRHMRVTSTRAPAALAVTVGRA
ncbi:hypothetical protein [Spirillospora sp. NBC_01491]|uniref:hypothetical protein n=1 Tax=Spirillospora sp. NBC_01491 TaxID=2976007 RepID=UPI002E3296C2|nr:hypothetical protein [Spirillospora sp. NBC_01491]